MNNFLKKLAYYDGTTHLNKVLHKQANLSATQQALVHCNKILKEARASILRIDRHQGHNKVYEYLLSQDGQKEFNLLGHIKNKISTLSMLSSTEKNKELANLCKNGINNLKKASEAILSHMGNGFTELLDQQGDQANTLRTQLREKMSHYQTFGSPTPVNDQEAQTAMAALDQAIRDSESIPPPQTLTYPNSK